MLTYEYNYIFKVYNKYTLLLQIMQALSDTFKENIYIPPQIIPRFLESPGEKW